MNDIHTSSFPKVPNDIAVPSEGTVSLQRHGVTFTGQWAVTGSRLVVYLGIDEESTLLGMFEKEPANLARIVLADLLKRQLEK
jgi:hypothetical protein